MLSSFRFLLLTLSDIPQLARALRVRKLLDWAPLIISSALGGDYLHLALILATAISALNIVLDALFRRLKVIKVTLHEPKPRDKQPPASFLLCESVVWA
jgi:hypothetical protein